jgi:hypothetical protein
MFARFLIPPAALITLPEYMGAQVREYPLSALHGWLPDRLCSFIR